MCGIFAYLSNDISFTEIEKNFKLTQHRGPDHFNIFNYNNCTFGFHRLSINGLDEISNQPIYLDNKLFVMANAEIYNYKQLAIDYNIKLKTNSDCEIIIHLYKLLGIEKTIKLLDGVFSFIIVDNNVVYIGRDPIGVRPLFMGLNKEKRYCFSSEAKALINLCDDIMQFNPGNYGFIDTEHKLYTKSYITDLYPTKQLTNNILSSELRQYNLKDLKYNMVTDNINKLLTHAVNKRLLSNREIGCFLSGGFDSSIITSIVSRKIQNVHTFSIGLKGYHSPDLEAAEVVAKYLNTTHHRVEFTIEEGINALDDVIYSLESYDVTTIRASVPQYLLSKYVKENTDVTVVLSGEGADEICGYQYLKNAPNEDEFIKETDKMIKDLYQFDVLRTDRTTTRWSLEVRVPFLDKSFIQFMMSINPSFKMCKNVIEKKIFRDAFDDKSYLPDEILWRNKNAFSDAVSYSWVDQLKEHINKEVSDLEYNTERLKYTHNMPYDKESYYYRKIFEQKFPNRGSFIEHYWKPNQEWFDKEIKDPSARVLSCFDDGKDYLNIELDNCGLNNDTLNK